MKYTPVDVRLEFESSKVFPENTSAFCLILHDKKVQYKPIIGEVKKSKGGGISYIYKYYFKFHHFN